MNSQSTSTEQGSGKYNTSEDNDIISKYIGSIGKWQIIWGVWLSMYGIPSTMFLYSNVFQALDQDFWCKKPDHLVGLPIEIWRNLSKSLNQCELLNADYESMNTSQFTWLYFAKLNQSDLMDCWSLVYDNSLMGPTMISEWNLVCDNKHMSVLIGTIFLTGSLFGSLLSGWVSDKFGRKSALNIFILIVVLSSIGIVLTPSFILFLSLRFILGMSASAITNISNVFVVEIVSGKWSSIFNIVGTTSYPIGYLLCAAVSYYAFHWRSIQLGLTVVILIFMFSWYIIPESPKWLLAKGRTDDLIKTIEQAAQLNKLILPENYKHCLSVVDMKSSEKVSFFAIFRTKYLRTSVVLFTFWFCLMQIYNGTTLELGNMSENIFTSTVFTSVAELIAIFISIPLVWNFGLRINLFVFTIVAGLSAVAMNFVAPDSQLIITILTVIIRFCTGISNALIPVFTALQYPTSIRCVGCGWCWFFGFIGQIMVSYLWNLQYIYFFLPITISGLLAIAAASLLFLFKDLSGTTNFI